MHITSVTLRFASFCLLFFINIQCTTDIANKNIHASTLLSTLEKNLQNPSYVESILPYDLHYLTLLLQHGNDTKQGCEYHQSIIRLFINLFKKCPCINASILDEFVATIPPLLKECIQPTEAKKILQQAQLLDFEMVNRFQASVNGILLQSLSSQYQLFKQNPEMFLHTLSQNITVLAQEEIAIEHMRSTLIRFLETTIQKAVWRPDTFKESWTNVKQLSKHLSLLLETNILDDMFDLDDLYWSLLTRYCYFLKIYATTIPLSFFEAIEKEVDNNPPLIVTLEEQEQFIEPKKAYFKRVVLDCKTKLIALKHGILVS